MDQSLIFILFAVLLLLFAYLVSFNIWLTAIFSGIRISLMEMFFMKIRRSPIRDIINSLIVSHKSGHPVPLVELEVHGLADGNVDEAMKAYVKCRLEGVEVTFSEICKEELAGKKWEQIVNEKRSKLDTEELRKSISRKILLELSDDHIREVETYIANLK